MSTAVADQEKNRVALSSVIAAFFLTGFKLTTGIMTGSMGILAEAAHSALDLIAAVITLFAVRFSGRPADREHTYGHGKIENLSALAETLLLLLTCGWIIYESVKRLLFTEVHVEVSLWAFAVVILSIIIDFGRSRALARTAKKHNSQALEADALHFSTDIWSSRVVLDGSDPGADRQTNRHRLADQGRCRSRPHRRRHRDPCQPAARQKDGQRPARCHPRRPDQQRSARRSWSRGC